MTNHTFNNVDVSVNSGCEKEQVALAELKTKLSIFDGEFDFDGIIPMPKELKKVLDYGFDNCPSDYKNEGGCYVPRDILIRKRWIKEHGFDNWYDWSWSTGDTKGNSYDVDICANFDDELTVKFLTAWGAPIKIFEKMREYCEQHNLNLSWDVCHEFEEGTFNLMDMD